MLRTEAGIEMPVSVSHHWKAALPTVSTVSGMTDVLHPNTSVFPSSVRQQFPSEPKMGFPFATSMTSKEQHPLKASSSISTRPAGR